MRGSAIAVRPLGQEASGPPDELSVRVDLALLAQVADHVPVQPGPVLGAGLGKPRAEREVHRAADLLVEEDVAREPVDLVVEAERDLAQDPGALVDVEQRAEVFLALSRLGLDDAPALEAQAHVLDLASLEDRRELVADLALGLRLDGAGEDLSVGHVEAPVGRDPAPAGDADAEIRVGAENPQLAYALELPHPRAELCGGRPPVVRRL